MSDLLNETQVRTILEQVHPLFYPDAKLYPIQEVRIAFAFPQKVYYLDAHDYDVNGEQGVIFTKCIRVMDEKHIYFKFPDAEF